MSNQTTTSTFEEAPASWNTRYITPDGFTCQITLRGETGSEVLTRAQTAMNWLREQDCQPYYSGGYRAGNGNNSPQTNQENLTLPDGNPNPAWCSIHNFAMKRREKDGQVWFSHKAPDGSWCKGEAKNGN